MCPPATQDLELNTKNRDSAIQSEHIQYGPMNLEDEVYWDKLGDHWKTTPEVAKESNCSNCAAFDISPRMEECMPGSLQEDGRLGYCWMHNFKCHSARTCYTWAGGGPISEDKVSAEWQERNLKNLQEKDDRCTRIAKRKYDTWPSAYASGAVVKCRDGKIWKDLKEEDIEAIIEEEIEEFIQEKKQSSEDAGDLRKWFGRKGEKGSKGGWVDCNAPDGDGGYKECAQGKRKKKPYCRPTPSACKTEPKKESKLEEFVRQIVSEEDLEEKKKKACKPSKGKRFAKRVDGKCRSYGQAGKAKSGGDRIRPGTAKGDAYCARSAKIKKCKNPPCANALSRKKWKCRGSKSVA